MIQSRFMRCLKFNLIRLESWRKLIRKKSSIVKIMNNFRMESEDSQRSPRRSKGKDYLWRRHVNRKSEKYSSFAYKLYDIIENKKYRESPISWRIFTISNSQNIIDRKGCWGPVGLIKEHYLKKSNIGTMGIEQSLDRSKTNFDVPLLILISLESGS